MIVKNEAAFIEGCLLSLQGLVDEIVIADTGSTDATLDIIAKFDCKLVNYAWHDDFSAARNFALSHASGDWILYIDADERLATDANVPLGTLLQDDAVATRIMFRPRSDTTCYDELRLFRNDPRIRFEGAMHETMVPSVERTAKADGLKIVNDYRVSLEHLGFDGDQMHKHTRNVPLLLSAIERDPGRVYLRFHLGYTLNEIDRIDDAADQLTAGLDAAFKPGASERAQAEGSMCAQVLAGILLRRGETEAALAAVERGEHLYAGNLALTWAKARCLLADQKPEDTLALLDPLLELDAETFFDPKLAYAKSLFTEDVPATMGSACFHLKDYTRAADLFGKALAAAPDNKEYAAKQALSLARQGKTPS